jgi:hypothetical protein
VVSSSPVNSHGTDASVSITHDLTRGNVALAYTRSLVPYGIGYLLERQQLTASATRQLTPYLDANISLLRIENNQAAVQLGLDRRSIDNAIAGLTWHPAETWSLGFQLAAIRTQILGRSNGTVTTVGTVNEWRSSVYMTWSPRPNVRSW